MTHPTPDAAGPACPQRHTCQQNDFGGRIMQLIKELTPTERTQMVVLIDDILTKSRQTNSATAKPEGKRGKKR